MRRLSRGALLSPKTVLFPTSPARRLSGQAGATEGHSISIEGNIGVGKSTFLRLMNKAKGLEGNILQKFYEEPNRYAYTFQSYAFITRFVQHNEGVQSNPEKLRILERSVFTDRNVFVSSLKDNGYLTDMEESLYYEWFDPVLQTLPSLIPDVVVYLRASPEACMNRLKIRSRSEEVGIKMEYLELLHKKHEEWLVDGTSRAGEGGKAGEKLTKENQTLPGVWLRTFVPNSEVGQLTNKPLLIVDCEPNAKAEVGLSNFNFQSVESVLRLLNVLS